MAAAIGADAGERPLHAGRAERAFEGADPRLLALRREVAPAALAVGPQLEHLSTQIIARSEATRQSRHGGCAVLDCFASLAMTVGHAAFTAAQMLSTTSATRASSSPSAMTR